MGAGASAKKGTEGKEPVITKIGKVESTSNMWTLEDAKAFAGDACDFDKAASFGMMMDADRLVPKCQVLTEACLIKVCSDYDGLLPQPKKPKKQTCVVQIYIASHEFGGTDKSCNGHRYDTIPFCNGMINAGMACYPVHYVHQQHDTFFEVMEHMDAILVRCNPGQIKADGGDGRYPGAVQSRSDQGRWW